MTSSRRGTLATTLLCLIALSTTLTRATWAHIEGRDLLEDTDIVVVAKLIDASEVTANKIDYGQGILEVQQVLFPEDLEVDTLLLRWRNPTNLSCPRVRPQLHEGEVSLWLLTRSEDGSVRADYPRRTIGLDEESLSVHDRFLSEIWPLTGDESYDAKVLAIDDLLLSFGRQ